MEIGEETSPASDPTSPDPNISLASLANFYSLLPRGRRWLICVLTSGATTDRHDLKLQRRQRPQVCSAVRGADAVALLQHVRDSGPMRRNRESPQQARQVRH